jgi:hypothetical protein
MAHSVDECHDFPGMAECLANPLKFQGTAILGLNCSFWDELCVMNNYFRAPIRTFVAGLLAVLPVVLTVAVIVWVASLVDQFVGPHSAVGKLLVSIGLTIVETRVAAYLISIVFVLCAIYTVGLLVEAGVQRRLQAFIDSGLRRIPLIGSVYDLTHRFAGGQLAVFQGANEVPLSESYGPSEQRRKTAN